LYERREAIIAGKIEPTEAEIEAGQAADSDDEEDEEEEGARISEVTDEKDEDSKVAGIPEFWLTALRNHVAISETITDRDEEVLRKLENIRLSYPDGERPGFKLHFTFGKNDFFEDTELVKTYFYQVSRGSVTTRKANGQEQVGYGGDFVYDKAIGHDIKWKEDKDLTKKVEIKKQRNKCE